MLLQEANFEISIIVSLTNIPKMVSCYGKWKNKDQQRKKKKNAEHLLCCCTSFGDFSKNGIQPHEILIKAVTSNT